MEPSPFPLVPFTVGATGSRETRMRKLWLLAAAAAVLGALPSSAFAQFIGTDGVYNMNKTSGNTFTSIIGAGGVFVGDGDDNGFTVTLAAPFTYYGTSFTTAGVSTNA